MNVSISQLVDDFDTTVTTIQAVIALYALVMAGLMLTGGKLGDIWGRRRAFAIGLCIYARRLGPDRGLLERAGADARLVGAGGDRRGARPAGAGRARRRATIEGRERAIAYGVLGGVAGAGIAVGPILGGWVDDRADLAARLRRRGRRRDRDPARHAADLASPQRERPGPASTGSAASSRRSGLAPDRLRRPAGEQLGLAAAAQLADRAVRLLADPVRDRRRRRSSSPPSSAWERRREERGLGAAASTSACFGIPPLRGGVAMLLAQNLILMGDLLHDPALPADRPGPRRAGNRGADAARLGRPLPQPRSPARRWPSASPPRPLVRGGPGDRLRLRRCCCSGRSSPNSTTAPSSIAMGVLGVGMGLIVSQLGNVVQSAVGDDDRSEAGGLQNTAQQLGSSLGTALLGAIVITGLLTAFSANIADDPQISTGRRAAGRGAARAPAAASSPPNRSSERRPRQGVDAGRRRRARRQLRRRPAEGAEDRLPVRRLPRPRLLLGDPPPADPALRRARGECRGPARAQRLRSA